MLNSKALSLYVEYFDSHSRYCADLLEKKVNSGEFDILPFMTNCTIDIILGNKFFFFTIKVLWTIIKQCDNYCNLVESFDYLLKLFRNL